MAVSRAPRFVVFVDDQEGLARATEHFGSEGTYAISVENLGPDVRRWRRETLEDDVERVVEAHRARPFSSVVYWREPYVVIANRLSERLGLTSVLDDPIRARDKFLMKAALRPAVRCAECMPIGEAADLDRAGSQFFPGVLKPRYGFASICAVRVEGPRDAHRELREKRDKLVTTRLDRVDLGIPRDPDFVLESFVDGTEHTVESFVANGTVTVQIISDKLAMMPPHFVETGDLMPSRLEEPRQRRLREAARASVEALGIRHGWTHAEIKLSGGEPVVMEIGARMGGGYTRELVHAAYGLDMLGALFDYVSSGRAPVLGPPRGVVLAQRFVVSGLSLVLDEGGAANGGTGDAVTIVPRESGRHRRGVHLGVPYSYEGTVAAYLMRARNVDELERLRTERTPELMPRVVEIPLPRACYRAYLAAKRALDGLRAR